MEDTGGAPCTPQHPPLSLQNPNSPRRSKSLKHKNGEGAWLLSPGGGVFASWRWSIVAGEERRGRGGVWDAGREWGWGGACGGGGVFGVGVVRVGGALAVGGACSEAGLSLDGASGSVGGVQGGPGFGQGPSSPPYSPPGEIGGNPDPFKVSLGWDAVGGETVPSPSSVPPGMSLSLTGPDSALCPPPHSTATRRESTMRHWVPRSCGRCSPRCVARGAGSVTVGLRRLRWVQEKPYLQLDRVQGDWDSWGLSWLSSVPAGLASRLGTGTFVI